MSRYSGADSVQVAGAGGHHGLRARTAACAPATKPSAARLAVTDELPRIELELVRPRRTAGSPALAALVRTARALAPAQGWVRRVPVS